MVSTRSKRSKEAATTKKTSAEKKERKKSVANAAAVDSAVELNTTAGDNSVSSQDKDVHDKVEEIRTDHVNNAEGKNDEGADESVTNQKSTFAAQQQTLVQDDDDSNKVDLNKNSDDTRPDSTKVISKLVVKDKDKKSREKTTTTTSRGKKNLLSKLLPGYTAPLSLEAPSLQRYREGEGLTLDSMYREASRQELTKTKKAVSIVLEKNCLNNSNNSNTVGGLPESYLATASSFKQGARKRKDPGLSGWFGMRSSEQTEDLKRDLQLIRNRKYLSSNRFYKNPDKNKTGVVQSGTVIEGAAEYYSSRLTKKQRRDNLVDEILADPEASAYVQNKYRERQRANQEKHEKQRKQFRKRQRR